MARSKQSATLDFRILTVAALILLALIVIGVRLWWVQVKLYAHYKGKIQGSSEVTVRVSSVRWAFSDRYVVDYYLPDLVSCYRKQYGTPPMVDYLRKSADGMLRETKEEDIFQMVDQTIIPRLEQLKVAEPYNSQRLRTHYRNNTLVPFIYREDLDFSTISKFAEKDLGLPGVQVNVRPG